MKRSHRVSAFFGVLSAVCVCLLLFAGTLSVGAANNPYFSVQKADPFGNYAISVIGDSISHGANCPQIYEQSYIARIKQAMWSEVGYENYGFASMENTMWNSIGEFREVHHASPDSNWTGTRKNDNLGRYNLAATKQGATLTYTVSKSFAYFTVYYEVNSNGGTFDIVTSNGTTSVDTSRGLTSKIGRSAYVVFPANKTITIKVTSSGKTVAINGIGYYQDTAGVVINNYASNGSKLIEVDNNVLDFVCSSDVLLMSHGYNDSHFGQNVTANRTAFTEKINYIIAKTKETGCRVVVNDMCWNCGEDNFFRTELRRLAKETGGVYASTQDAYGNQLIATLGDGVHPGPDGHAMVASTILNAMNTAAPVEENGYVKYWSAPVNDASQWWVIDTTINAIATAPTAVSPVLNTTTNSSGAVFTRTAASPNAWPDARTFISKRFDLSQASFYYDLSAECYWNMTLTFGSNRDTTENNEVLRLSKYIGAQHGLTLGYDDDLPAGNYKGSINLASAIADAKAIGRLNADAVVDLSSTYIGRFHIWHVAGEVGTSNVTLHDSFIGYQTTVVGDVTGDGIMNTTDVRLILKSIIGGVTFTDAQSAAADYDQNGKIDTVDVRVMLRTITGG
ncbi:MAG: hypothetical protein IJU16_00995 [Clostridia bacterium]|nr:hypothetical protein [Clostridia bacterium]